jgi:Aldo/keto reductase family
MEIGIEMTRVFTLKDATTILDTFQKYGHNEIDTSRVYGEGSSEEYLGNLDWRKRGLIMDTKLYPTYVSPHMAKESYSHKPEDLRKGLMASLEALKTDKLDMWYLHGPDRATPFEDTLREVNNLHKEGYFERFGISNYYSWEVAKICEICKKNGWIMPTYVPFGLPLPFEATALEFDPHVQPTHDDSADTHSLFPVYTKVSTTSGTAPSNPNSSPASATTASRSTPSTRSRAVS